jgi:hypothetical protein
MCFNKDSVNLWVICYFNIKLANGTNEYFLTTYYIWQKHTEEPNIKHEEHEEHEDKYKHEDVENKNEAVPPQPKQKYQVFCLFPIVIRAKNA